MARNARIPALPPLLGFVFTAAALAVSPVDGSAQARWERRQAPTEVGPTVFHATQAMNVPTAVTPGGGELLFEIAHRFVPPISDAEDALFGLDGGVRLRLGFTYGITDAVAVALTRSNLDDNLDLSAKVRFLEGDGPVKYQLAAAGGIAWNTEVLAGAGSTRQSWAQAIVNLGLGDRVAFGVVPTWIQNPLVSQDGEDDALSVGLHGQVYLSPVVSLVGEWVVSEARGELTDDPAALSLELETGGHFFRLGVTNSLRLNTAQHFAGARQSFDPSEWRLAFNVTRALAF